MQKLSNFINNEFVAPKAGLYLDNFNPSTGKVYSLVPDSDSDDLELAFNAANAAFKGWSGLTDQERSRYLNLIADGIEKRIDEFAAAESRDQGKPVTLSKNMDISRAIYNFRFFAGAILHHEEKSTISFGRAKALNYTIRKPVGVAGLISPWNLPLYLLTWKIAPAISVGNTVVCKPSEFTSMTAWLLASVIAEVGVPKGVVNIVFGTGPKVGNALVAHPKIPLISFTGGTKTGEQILKTSAPFFKKVSLELGGKNPNIIFDDADLDECVSTSVRSSFLNQGEICLCGSRIFVQEKIYDQFLERFTKLASTWKVGDPFQANDMGAIVSLQHLEKIMSYIEIARQEGGKIEIGGKKPDSLGEDHKDGYFLEPTIITGLPITSRLLNEEIFGPVVTVTPFKTEEEAIEWANGVDYGLSTSIWTQNVSRANRVAMQIDAGTVWVNNWMERDLRMPFGGVKQSGIGREGGEYSIDFYTEHKVICTKLC